MPRKRNKYRAVRTNGYASKFEARVAGLLRSQLASGQELLEQVPVKFACGAQYICDFVVREGDIPVRYVEAKGLQTPVWRLKLRMLKHEHPEIHAMLDIITPKNIGDYMLGLLFMFYCLDSWGFQTICMVA